jgi:hypothetical protein
MWWFPPGWNRVRRDHHMLGNHSPIQYHHTIFNCTMHPINCINSRGVDRGHIPKHNSFQKQPTSDRHRWHLGTFPNHGIITYFNRIMKLAIEVSLMELWQHFAQNSKSSPIAITHQGWFRWDPLKHLLVFGRSISTILFLKNTDGEIPRIDADRDTISLNRFEMKLDWLF